jgi:hypothetical protein
MAAARLGTYARTTSGVMSYAESGQPWMGMVRANPPDRPPSGGKNTPTLTTPPR